MACFNLLALVNNIAMNMLVQISLWVSVFNSFGNISKSSTGTSCDKELSCQVHIGYIILHSQTQCTKVSISATSPHHLLFACLVLFCVLIVAILMAMNFFSFFFLSDPFSCHHLGSHLHLLLSLWSRLLVCLFLANWHMLFLLLYASPTTSFTGEVSGSSFLWAVFVIPLSMYHWTLQSVIVIPALREYLLEVKPLLTLHAC